MGALRLYLALCVVADHAGAFPFPTLSGSQAVQLFFLISGFHMSLVQDAYPSTRAFWKSRFLRIFPPAWTVLALGALGSLASGLLWNRWVLLHGWPGVLEHNGLAGAALAGISNVTLFFEDWIMFLTHEAGRSLGFTSDFARDAHPLYKLLVLPQMWSVGLELTFYLLVPRLWKQSTARLLALAAFCTALRVSAYACLGGTRDPWDNRFFPFELGIFLLGMASQRLGHGAKPLPRASFPVRTTLLMAAFVGIAGLHGAAVRLVGLSWASLAAIPLWAVALPTLFSTTRECSRDRLLGDLSFPVYLVHMLAIPMASHLGITDARLIGPACAAISLMLALGLWAWVERPMDRIRRRGRVSP
jgi:peptidoglycan/LPS O-acetylase OafA/YrhL